MIECLDLGAYLEQALDVRQEALGLGASESGLTRRSLAKHARSRGLRAFGCRIDRELAGFALGENLDMRWWWARSTEDCLKTYRPGASIAGSFAVLELHVRPRFQRLGIGSALIGLLCRDTGRPKAVLTTFEQSASAKPFYHRLGFRELGLPGLSVCSPYDVLTAGLPLRPPAPHR